MLIPQAFVEAMATKTQQQDKEEVMCMRVCDVCGHDFKDASKFKPRHYCSDNCSDYHKFKNAIEKALLNMEATKEATSLIRGDMFRFANILSKRTVTK